MRVVRDGIGWVGLVWLSLLAGCGSGTSNPTGDLNRDTGTIQAGCAATTFVDAVTSWDEVTVSNGSVPSIQAAIENSDKTRPTKITVTAGIYTGRCLYIEDHERSASAPLWLKAQGEVQIDCNNGNGQAFGFAHVSYVAVEGFTIGPASGFYRDSGIHFSGSPVQPDDPSHYGEYQISHHVVIKGNTLRNLYRGTDGDSNPDAFESGCCDGTKLNQVEYGWVLNNTVRRIARHGMDNVGVHHAAYCGNQILDVVGSGVGMEAKGGSYDILFEKNLIFRARHRGIMLGGEGTDNVYMYPWNYPVEGSDQVARNNVIVNAAEGSFGFFGCRNCTALNNTVWLTSDYLSTPGIEASEINLFRSFHSVLESSGSEWGGPRRVGEVLPSTNNLVLNNVFGAATPIVACAFNVSEQGVSGLQMVKNLWWNGGNPLPECGTGATTLETYESKTSLMSGTNPLITSPGSTSSFPDLRPQSGSPMRSLGMSHAYVPTTDYAGSPRSTSAPTLGAYE